MVKNGYLKKKLLFPEIIFHDDATLLKMMRHLI